MSDLLDDLIQERKQKALEYKAYLARIVELTRQAKNPEASRYPSRIGTAAQRALYDNLRDSVNVTQESREPYGNGVPEDAASRLAVAVDTAIRNSRRADWRGTRMKRREVRISIKRVLGDDDGLVDEIFELAVNQREY